MYPTTKMPSIATSIFARIFVYFYQKYKNLDGILVLGTNLNTQEAALNFEQSYNIPIVQTNRALIWSCLREHQINIKLCG